MTTSLRSRAFPNKAQSDARWLAGRGTLPLVTEAAALRSDQGHFVNWPLFGPAANRHRPALSLTMVAAALVLTVDTHFVNTPFSLRQAAVFFDLVALVILPLVVVTFEWEVECVATA